MIPLDTPTPPRVRRAQPPRVNLDGPSQNLRSKYAGCVSAKYNLAAHAIQAIESICYLGANFVVNPITGDVEEYSHLIKGPNKLIW